MKITVNCAKKITVNNTLKHKKNVRKKTSVISVCCRMYSNSVKTKNVDETRIKINETIFGSIL
jgi:hypothetical protein